MILVGLRSPFLITRSTSMVILSLERRVDGRRGKLAHALLSILPCDISKYVVYNTLKYINI